VIVGSALVPAQQVRKVMGEGLQLIRWAAGLADYQDVRGAGLDQQRAALWQGSWGQHERPSALALDGGPEFVQAPGQRAQVRAEGGIGHWHRLLDQW
jgi:hypothetical protein